jgi:predicted DNA-binding transcriptional regulator AlpA
MESLMPDKLLPALLSKDDLCASLGISKCTIENIVRNGTFPPPVRLGKCVYWSEVAVHSWRRRRFAGQEAWQC